MNDDIKLLLYKLFKKLDTLIAIHYQTNYLSNTVKLSKIQDKLIELNKNNLLKLKYIYNESYNLIYIPNENDIIIDVMPMPMPNNNESIELTRCNLIKNLNSRLLKFKLKLDEYFKENSKITSLNDIPNYKITNTKVQKSSISSTINTLKLNKIEKLSNPRSKFEYHEKKITNNNSKLSLLERIKLKETLQKEKEEKSNLKSTSFNSNSNIKLIYDIIYEQSPKFNSDKLQINLSFKKLNQLIKDSLNITTSLNDMNKLIELICYKLNLIIVKIGDIKLIKLRLLNRDDDLKKLSE
ncbi:hypothetical protein CANARDRAFT_6370 [[Candida] arabinofermentans NRRL YB-2248]|uniref:DNA replication factor Cdt1 C-terminal domain-containing protein n=1 Tax=[Candida] arabinofermentans NRRL YB-2248 TaxID=983967 RepID=A0A1E4T500_9ASCO|nr:hypothetical protein CANARDRAFT_6370 [[Candida] arabinofermentans NRRL YB-2248]